jgi:hypothetical protein
MKVNLLIKKSLISIFVSVFMLHTISLAKKNSTIDEVSVNVITQSLDSMDIESLKGWIYSRLEIFSDEKKDFKVSKNHIYTHVVKIYIDSIILIDYLKYSKQLDVADSVSSVTWQIEEKMRFINNANIYSNSVTETVIKRAYKSVEHPVMYVRLEIVDVNGKISFKTKEELKSSSPVPVNEQKQVKDLLGILKSYLQDKIPYLHL